MTAVLLKSIITLSILSNMFMISNFVMGVSFTKLRPHPTGHFRLSHEYRTIKAVSLMNCLIQNRLDNKCKAVSYNERFRYCELNDKSGIYDVFDLTNTDGWKTYNVFNETAGEESDLGHYRLLGLVPVSLHLQSNIGDVAGLNVNNLQSLKALDVEYKRWEGKWQSAGEKPISPKGFTGPCKTDWHYYEGSCYLFQINGDDNKKSWEDATDACANEGAGLVRIGSKDEDDFILAKFEELNSGTTDLFIFTAGNDQVEEGRWIWSGRSGTMSETMQYRNWIGDEPNNLEGNENCLALWPIHKGWFDISCSGKNYYICED